MTQDYTPFKVGLVLNKNAKITKALKNTNKRLFSFSLQLSCWRCGNKMKNIIKFSRKNTLEHYMNFMPTLLRQQAMWIVGANKWKNFQNP